MRRAPAPDAWTALVLRTMGTDEIRRVLEAGEEDRPDHLRWLRAELLRRTRNSAILSTEVER